MVPEGCQTPLSAVTILLPLCIIVAGKATFIVEYAFTTEAQRLINSIIWRFFVLKKLCFAFQLLGDHL
jgi:hypothetical protein